jgi:ankyrin repeat protein
MALSRRLGHPVRKGKPTPLREPASIEPAPIEPWVDQVLFGDAADLQRLLDKGFDPNSATKSGMTALMLAAPDVEKMTLLLDRGAKVNARRPASGYTVLLMSALYADSAPAVRLLVSRGASQPQEPVFGKATPLALAALAGNAASVKLLHDAGESADAVFDYAGLSSAAPLLLMVPTDDLAVATALLDAGAAVDRPDSEGLTPLDWAVLGNHVELAQLFLARGADVNRLDKHGMTPLLYAASIDFGESAMLDLLLKSGARADVRTLENLTALDLARKNQHTHLLPSLSRPQ